MWGFLCQEQENAIASFFASYTAEHSVYLLLVKRMFRQVHDGRMSCEEHG
jgi:hypothetical protein